MLLLVQNQTWRSKHPDNIMTEGRCFCGRLTVAEKFLQSPQKLCSIRQQMLVFGQFYWTCLKLHVVCGGGNFHPVSHVNSRQLQFFFSLRFKIWQSGCITCLNKFSTIHWRFYLLWVENNILTVSDTFCSQTLQFTAGSSDVTELEGNVWFHVFCINN